MAGIDVSDLQIAFPLYHGNAASLRKRMGRAMSGRLGHDARDRVVVRALNGLSFSVRPGERLGLIGRNGAGKTTLLRALAGIYEPVGGRVSVRGRIGALLDTNLGMVAELTGRENIRLRGLYSGLDSAAIAGVEQDVSAFAELGPFLDLPLRSYSSGMQIRLAFGLATAGRPQVLLMDEWFLAGDAAFLSRAQSRLERMIEEADILVVSTHQAEILATWCTRVLWMDQGRIRMDGPPGTVLPAYLGRA
ncbi:MULTISPECIES: ABC transporter ATP-binding protein [Nguyenibacter]|uniref:ABC transporter ATP-binding protein n=1 Tax=Nguyenibacter vanlangensis TaxID=1216886 RepID=A0A7Y7M4U5_9PROT|nr:MULTISPECIES: ABC transporter ATP-binding protein [Nguyenibacter]NVN11215.1 ABC transporter ATP-binding protein [Nguyenibacter vanlangensis]WRH87194.1 ABC transporter ATP-binding protein [Nguyenibacter sp. L1]